MTGEFLSIHRLHGNIMEKWTEKKKFNQTKINFLHIYRGMKKVYGFGLTLILAKCWQEYTHYKYTCTLPFNISKKTIIAKSFLIFFKRELNTKTSPLIIFSIVGNELLAISDTLKALYSLIKQPTACQVIIRNFHFLFLQDITYKVPNTKLLTCSIYILGKNILNKTIITKLPKQLNGGGDLHKTLLIRSTIEEKATSKISFLIRIRKKEWSPPTTWAGSVCLDWWLPKPPEGAEITGVSLLTATRSSTSVL